MNNLQSTIEVVKQNLNEQLQKEFLNSKLPINCSDDLIEMPHITIFANKKWSKKNKKTPINSDFSDMLELDYDKHTSIISQIHLWTIISNECYQHHLGIIKRLTRDIFNLVQNFCSQYKLPLVMVPFEITLPENNECEIVITSLPKFENLRFWNFDDNSKYLNIQDFYMSQAIILENTVKVLKDIGYFNIK